MTRTIYCERRNLFVGILCLAGFLAMFAFFLFALLEEPSSFREPTSPVRFVVLLFPLSLIALCGYGIWTHLVHCIDLSDDEIRVRLPLRDYAFRIASIEQLDWRRGVRLQSAVRKVTLDLKNYSPEDRIALIMKLWRAVPEERQTGWPEYCDRSALPLHDRLFGKPILSRTLEKGQVAITRQRYDRMLKWLLPGSVLVAIALGPWTRWVSLFLVPSVAIALWWMLRSSTPKSGYIDRSLSGQREMLWLPIMFCLLIPTLALTRLAEYLGTEEQITGTVFVVLFVSYLALIFYFGHKADKVQKKRLAVERPKSVARWQAIFEGQSSSCE